MVNKLDIVIEKLKQENYSPSIKTELLREKEWSQIVWKAVGDDCFIYQDDIAIEDDKIAWFQSSRRDDHLLKVYIGDQLFTWVPETYNPIFGCYCLLLEWYKGHLIFIYQEKHEIYICSIKDNEVRHFNFHGEEIERKGDLISYETYMGKTPDKIKLIKIPELIVLNPIDRDEAEKLGLIPEGLNRPGNFLGFTK